MRLRILAGLVLLTLISALAAYGGFLRWGWAVIGLILLGIAVYDVVQKRHTLLRNYPVIAHMRFLLEMVRPEIQQYFIESDTSEDPISRIYRNVVYARAKGELETVPFGSELDLYAQDYQWVNHSSFPVDVKALDFRVTVGGPECRQPYQASLMNISAMSYGSISKAAVMALGKGAKTGGFFLNTGEGGLSPYHLDSGADLVWQLGTAYFGARDEKGYFDPVCFREKALLPQVKMIEIKISQGAKPGHGGILPAVKVDAEVASIRKVEIGKTVFSPPGHTAFTTPNELCEFIGRLRELSDGKPIGFKLCIGRREEFLKMCEAMAHTGILPDFISVDGGEGGTGAAPFDFINHVGSPLKEALYFVHTSLQNQGLRDRIKLIATGKVFSAVNMFERIALGADICASARGMMLALGCIQAYRCNTNKCPTGIATTDRRLYRGMDIEDKAVRVANFHRRTLLAMGDLLGAAGLHSPAEIDLSHISRRHDGRVVTLREMFEHTPEISTGEQRAPGQSAQGENRPPTPPSTAAAH